MTEDEKPYEEQSTDQPARHKRKTYDLFEPAQRLTNPRVSNSRFIEDIAKKRIANASPYELATAKLFVNGFIQLGKQFRGKIMPLRSVTQFAAGSLLPVSAYDTVLTKEQRDLLKSVYFEYAPP